MDKIDFRLCGSLPTSHSVEAKDFLLCIITGGIPTKLTSSANSNRSTSSNSNGSSLSNSSKSGELDPAACWSFPKVSLQFIPLNSADLDIKEHARSSSISNGSGSSNSRKLEGFDPDACGPFRNFSSQVTPLNSGGKGIERLEDSFTNGPS
mmetsp:Transcript_29602/g.45696  ORF Transcript_29602/g.45696 Transcript_29602/m.45696 type:complete len:151 (+) Transcript_29602:271-723(+)